MALLKYLCNHSLSFACKSQSFVNHINVFQSVQRAGKCLHFISDFSFEEIGALLSALEIRGLSLVIKVESSDEIHEIYEHIMEFCSKK